MDIVINIAVFLISAVIFTFVGIMIRKKIAESKMQSAESEAKKILEMANIEAENKKKEEIFKAKEEIMSARKDLDQEIRERRGEVQSQERRLIQKEENLERKQDIVEKKEKDLEKKYLELDNKKSELQEIFSRQMAELQRISGLSKEDAKKILLSELDKQLTVEKATLVREMESKLKEEADKSAKEVIGYAIQKCAADHTSETTVSIVALPNDDMKGRIIGREGRNIKAIEQSTGVDLIIDDTPEAITISCFDPVRREIARLSLETLIRDGRIQPGRIEEVVQKTKNELNEVIRKTGEDAIFELGISKIDKDIIMMLGKLKYRTSYGQNALQHSLEVAHLAGIMAAELGLNQQLARRAGLLHDLGKAIDHEMQGSHVELGAKFAKKHGEHPVVVNAIESHHGDVPATSVISILVAAADTLSAARPGSRSETIENYIQRLEKLEEMAKSFDGVDRVFAIQAGREIRIVVKPDKVDDLMAHKIARDIKTKIEEELTYPGHIKVTVIREVRANEIAK